MDEDFHRRIEAYRQVIAAEESSGAPDSDTVFDARRMRLWAFWMLGELESCFREYELLAELEHRRGKGQDEARRPPLWDGSPLAGRSLLVHLRQGGLGDLIQFARFVAPLGRLDGPVTILTRPELLGLFSGSFDRGLSWIASLPEAPCADLETWHYRLPFLQRWTFADLSASVPYLHPPADLQASWRSRLAGRPRPWVGLCWTSAPPGASRDERSAPLSCFAPLLAHRDVTFVSLLKEDHGVEIRPCGFADRILDFAPGLGNFVDTAALMAQLDLVVSIDTSIGHLAGALGKQTWLLLIHEASEIWSMGPHLDRVPWYPSVRLFRQPEPGNWDHLLNEAGRRLSELKAESRFRD